jgi:hypothetical protein
MNEFDQGDEDEFPADRGPRGMRGRGPPPRPTVPDRTYEELDLKQNGRAFSPQEAYQQENGVFTRTLPETIKSAVIIQFLQADFYGGHQNFCGQWVRIPDALVIFSWFMVGAPLALLLTFYFQFTFALHLNAIVVGAGEHGGPLLETCDGGEGLIADDVLRPAATVAFLALVEQQLLNIYDMHLWLEMFDSSPLHMPLRLAAFQATASDGGKTVVYRPVTGIQLLGRCICYAVLAVDGAVVCVTMIAGSGLVLRAETDYDVVMSALAATFVLELDRVAYALLVANALKKQSSGLPPLGMSKREVARRPRRYVLATAMTFWLNLALIWLMYQVSWRWWCA